ncbi:hypothetical protein EMMF5_004647 [Cystobasidiomycetes sp. EMM_F5]
MASVAVINGSSRGLGLAFTRYILQNTQLNVVATTSRKADAARSAILENLDGTKDAEGRLTTLDMDITDEKAIETAAKQVEEQFGKGQLRLMINVAGVLRPEKALTKINYDDLLESFRINTFGHIMAFKHFMPLLPTKSKQLDYDNDPAHGLIAPRLSVLASMTAKIGSIADNNNLGGWYSYRASKAATNQIIKTLNLELQRAGGAGGANSDKTNNSIAVALHPGTLLGTDLSKPFVDPKADSKDAEEKSQKPGVHTPEVGAEKLLNIIKGLDKSKGGKFFGWSGDEIRESFS